MAHEFELEQAVDAPPSAVYRAFTNGSALEEWWCDSATLGLPLTPIYYVSWQTGFQAMGRFTSVEEDARLAFTWVDGASPACNAEVTLEAGGEGTRVRLRYREIDNENQAHQLEQHWAAGLENLASVLETGIDLRYARRPMLGVWLGDPITEASAARLGVSHGLPLEGVIDGLSAQAAGLHSGDVITGIAGVAINDYPDVSRAMAGRQAGESVSVEYARDGEIHEATMELKPPPIPEVPWKPGALADRLADAYAEMDEALDAALAGLSEAEAGVHPADGEWSVRETLAHLIADERDTHARISMRAGGFGEADSFFNNSLMRVEPLIETFPTLSELLAEYRRAQAQTAATLRSLPASFAAQRGSYRRLASEIVEDRTNHLENHIAQIRAARGMPVE